MSGGLIQFTNGANSKLAAGISNSVLSLNVLSGHGARFPALTGSQFFYATLIDINDNVEVIKVTGRTNDTFTIVRGQDGTTPRAFSSQDYIGLLVPRIVLDAFLQDNAGVVNGGYTFSGNLIFSGTLSVIGAVNLSDLVTLGNNLRFGTKGLLGSSGTIRATASDGLQGRIYFTELEDRHCGYHLLGYYEMPSAELRVNGQQVWRNGLTGAALSQRLTTSGGTVNGIGDASSSLGVMEVLNNASGAAMMAFHRSGAWAGYFGLDTDNKWKVGGWSYGAFAYEVFLLGNTAQVLGRNQGGTGLAVAGAATNVLRSNGTDWVSEPAYTISTAAPSGTPADGTLWLQREA